MRRFRTVSMKSSAQRTSVLIKKKKKENLCYVQGQWRITTVPPFRNCALRGNHTAALDRGCGKSVSRGVCVKTGAVNVPSYARTHARHARGPQLIVRSRARATSRTCRNRNTRADPGPAARDRGPRLESKLRFLRNAHLAIALHRPVPNGNNRRDQVSYSVERTRRRERVVVSRTFS